MTAGRVASSGIFSFFGSRFRLSFGAVVSASEDLSFADSAFSTALAS
jgi:hypothetical protein